MEIVHQIEECQKSIATIITGMSLGMVNYQFDLKVEQMKGSNKGTNERNTTSSIGM